MNSKVDSLYQNIDNLSITLAGTAISVTPNYKIYRVAGQIGVACQMMVVTEPTPDMMNYARQGNPYYNTDYPTWIPRT